MESFDAPMSEAALKPRSFTKSDQPKSFESCGRYGFDSEVNDSEDSVDHV